MCAVRLFLQLMLNKKLTMLKLASDCKCLQIQKLSKREAFINPAQNMLMIMHVEKLFMKHWTERLHEIEWLDTFVRHLTYEGKWCGKNILLLLSTWYGSSHQRDKSIRNRRYTFCTAQFKFYHLPKSVACSRKISHD